MKPDAQSTVLLPDVPPYTALSRLVAQLTGPEPPTGRDVRLTVALIAADRLIGGLRGLEAEALRPRVRLELRALARLATELRDALPGAGQEG